MVRDPADATIAPHAAEADETAEFTRYTLMGADLHAVYIPEAYGGMGAYALATVIVTEERRGCASSSRVPAVNEPGTLRPIRPIPVLGADFPP